jgi:hypothetical protein
MKTTCASPALACRVRAANTSPAASLPLGAEGCGRRFLVTDAEAARLGAAQELRINGRGVHLFRGGWAAAGRGGAGLGAGRGGCLGGLPASSSSSSSSVFGLARGAGGRQLPCHTTAARIASRPPAAVLIGRPASLSRRSWTCIPLAEVESFGCVGSLLQLNYSAAGARPGRSRASVTLRCREAAAAHGELAAAAAAARAAGAPAPRDLGPSIRMPRGGGGREAKRPPVLHAFAGDWGKDSAGHSGQEGLGGAAAAAAGSRRGTPAPADLHWSPGGDDGCNPRCGRVGGGLRSFGGDAVFGLAAGGRERLAREKPGLETGKTVAHARNHVHLPHLTSPFFIFPPSLNAQPRGTTAAGRLC